MAAPIFCAGWQHGQWTSYNDGMVTLNAHFDGKVIVPDEPTGLAAGTRLRVTVEPMDQPESDGSVRLELPLLRGVDPALVRSIVEDLDLELENNGLEKFLHPTPSAKTP